MAVAILYGTAARFLGDLASIPLQEIASAWNVKKDLKKLQATLSTIQFVLVDAEQQQEKNNEVKDWLEKIKRAFYEVDDLIDDFATEALRQKLRKNKNRVVKEVRDFCSPSKNQIVSSFKISHKIKAVGDELDEIASDRSKFHFKEGLEVRPLKIRETHSFVPPSKVIGRDEDKKAILDLVMDDGSEENVSIIPIVGIGGLGKTTLAQLVYNDEKVTSPHFGLKMWVCVSDVFDVKVLVEKILKSAEKECGNVEMDQLQNRLRKCLNGNRCILVLDDMWNENREKWIELEELLMGGARGSKIVVTTRSEKVALIMMGNIASAAAYHLKGLSEDDCWSLFKQLAFKQGQLENPSLLKIGKEILKKCGGVPLAIRTVGSLLYLEDTEVEWLIVNDKLWELAQDENHILPTLKVSYDHLPYNLKKCFAYCSLFQKDSTIYKKTLIQLWMAQGFIQPEREGEEYSLEDIGDQYFKDILFRSFFQDEEKDDYGNIISCKMHDLVHDLAQSIAGMECSITNDDAENISERTYHVSVISDRGLWEVPTPLLKAKKARTFFLLSSRTLMTRSALDLLITSFMCLRVLDLQYTGIENVPSSTGKLKHLRYLDLSHNKMKTLPLSICKLQNLQTLKLLNCFELRELPIDIRRLISLRHLEIDGCYELTHMPFGLGELTSLRTLSLFVVGKDISISKSVGGIFELNGLSHLRGTLRIKGLENVRHGASGSIQELRKANLKAKQYLQVLALQWNPDVDGAADADANTAVLEDLQPHPNLKELDIKGYGGLSFPVWMMVNMVSSLSYLVRITLADCRKCQHLPWFGQLPFLEYLELTCLNSLEYIHNNSVDSSSSHPSSSLRGNVGSSAKEWSFFPSLKSLYLHHLPLLKEWSREVLVIANDDDMETAPAPHKVSLFSFPCLTELDINSCPSLISVPLLPSLEKLWMTYISEKLLQSMMTRVIETDSHITTTTIDYSSIPSSPLPSLKTLSICFCEDLVSLPEEGLQNLTSLQHLLIIQCHKLVHLPEEGLRGLISLQSLHINFCDSLTSISVSRGMQHLTALQKLEICNCPAFNWSDEDDGMQVLTALRSLQSLHISVLPKLVSLPHGLQHLTTLQALDILHCDGLVNLPEWIGNLASLRILHIINCQKLESLPDTMRCLTALKELEIDRCDILAERCQRERGTEWPKIAHIPKIRIECEWI